MNLRHLTIVIALATFAGQVFAHHGFAGRYDEENPITIEGTVVELQMINPHVMLVVAVRGDDGRVVRWNGLLGTVASITRDGWTKDTLNPGDRVSVLGAPAVQGAPDMLLMHDCVITLLDTGEEVRNTLGQEERGQRGF